MDSELKPCPFCGATDQTQTSPSLHRCKSCGAFASLMAVDVPGTWNTRPIEDALRAEVERLTAEIAKPEPMVPLRLVDEIETTVRNYSKGLCKRDRELIMAAIRAAREGAK